MRQIVKSDLQYQSGFNNEFATEALAGALPKGRNNPQKPAFGLYAEQLSGSAFTVPGEDNQRTWFYRILPSVKHSEFQSLKLGSWLTPPFHNAVPPTPQQLRWDPLPYAKGKVDFVDALFTVCGCGDVQTNSGCSVQLYAATESMRSRSLVNADGDMLIVPQEGGLLLKTEMGNLNLQPGDVGVVPRGVRFSVLLDAGKARGYVLENFGAHFQLPYKGVIGANGLANARDFLYPVAAYEDKQERYTLVQKFLGHLFSCELDHSPYDVVAWHGNYSPYKYDLNLFNTIGTVSFDHPDPSIFTVLTSPSGKPGVANVDFVLFPPRWQVAEDTFRPPWFHRNIMSEYMGLIFGVYDAKPAADGFVPGGGSLHNCMSAHGPEAEAFAKASKQPLKPDKIEDTLAFMFEANMVFVPTAQAMQATFLQKDYWQCWQGLKSNFSG